MRIIDGVELDDGVDEPDNYWDGWDDLFDEEPEDEREKIDGWGVGTNELESLWS